MSPPIKVLLVEDHEPSALYATIVLEQLGCTVYRVRDGVEATEAALRERFALILMDYHLPKRKGSDVTRILRTSELTSGGVRSVVIGVTASAMPQEIHELRESGMDEVLTKPLMIDDFTAALNRWLPIGVSHKEGYARGSNRLAR